MERNPLDPAMIAGVTNAPPKQRPDSAMSKMSLDTMMAMPAADDIEAEAAAPVALLLTLAERETLSAHADALKAAMSEVTETEAALALAERQARGLEAAKRRAGEVAAQAFMGSVVDMAVRDKLRSDVEQAEAAVAALPTLRDRAEESKRQRDACYGGLRMATRKALEQARNRQAREFERLAGELRTVVGHLDSTVQMLGGDTMGWFAHFVPELSLPALPMGIRTSHRGAVEMNFRASLLRHEHPFLTAVQTASRSWLQRQIEDSTGLPVGKIL